MVMMRRIQVLLSVCVSCFSASVLADKAENVSSCKIIQNSQERLKCYDELFGFEITGKNTKKPSSTSDLSETKALLETSNPASTAAPVTPKVIESMPATNNTAQQVLNQNKVTTFPSKDEITSDKIEKKRRGEASFGAEQLIQNASEDDVSEIEMKVLTISENARGIRTFVMSNGQVWREKQGSRLRVREGNTIVIRKGALSSYYLSTLSSNRSVRVNRVQ